MTAGNKLRLTATLCWLCRSRGVTAIVCFRRSLSQTKQMVGVLLWLLRGHLWAQTPVLLNFGSNSYKKINSANDQLKEKASILQVEPSAHPLQHLSTATPLQGLAFNLCLAAADSSPSPPPIALAARLTNHVGQTHDPFSGPCSTAQGQVLTACLALSGTIAGS